MVSDTTLDTDVFTAVRDVIVSAAVTFTDGTAVKTANVAASYNDRELSKPQIIIYPVNVEGTIDKFGSYYGKRFINVNIDCYYKNTYGIDVMAQAVNSALSETVIDGVELIATSSDYAFQSPGDSKYHLKALTFTYDRE